MQVPLLTPTNPSLFINIISMMKELCEDMTITFEERGVTFFSTDKEIYCIHLSKENWINYDCRIECTLFEKASQIYDRITKQIKIMDITTNKQNKKLRVGDVSNSIFVEKCD